MRRRVQRTATQTRLDTRVMRVRAKTINADARSIEAFITTETPVNEMDWERYEVVPRVLLASGAILPKSRQVPLLDCHMRYSTDNQLGSIRDLTKEDNAVSGTLSFSSAAETQWTKVREGHVTDVSAGFEVLDEQYIPAGETKKIKGREFSGPMNVATKWRLREGSITPIGADEAAKMRGLDLTNLPKPATPQTEKPKVNAELRKRCIAAGMDEKLDDVAAVTWLNENHSRVLSASPAPVNPAVPLDADAIANRAVTAALAEVDKRDKLREQVAREQREAFERDVDATLLLAFGGEIPSDVRSACLTAGTIDKAREVMTARKKKIEDETPLGRGGWGMEGGEAGRDKHRAVLQSALSFRAFENRGYGMADKLLPADKRAKGYEQFQHAPLIEIARECLIADGYTYRELAGLSRQALAIAAMGWPHKAGLRTMGAAYHTTGSLAYITLDAINKNLTNGYNEAPSTWRGPMRQAASVPDFKNKHVIKFSAAGNLPLWQDNKAPFETAFSNEKESYAVEARAETAGFSWQLLVNDDMDALSRVPALLGAAAARTVNAIAWAQVTSNPTLADGQALFLTSATGLRFRSNQTTGAGAPSVLTLQTLTNKMMQMRGLNTPEAAESADILNIIPVYIVAPTALRTTVLQLVRSTADPAASGNAGVFNTGQGLTPVFEPLLDAATNGTTAWYLFASPSQVDTIEVAFLQGQETPVINDYVDEATWTRKITVVQSFAAKAIDHRGVQKHVGA